MPGARKYTSTRLQMEIEARRQSDQKVEYLLNRLDQFQEQMDKMQQQLSFQNSNITSNGSYNATQNLRAAPTHHDEVEEEEEEEEEEAAGSYAGDDMDDMHLDGDDDLILNRRVVLPEEQRNEGGRDVILYNVVRPYDVPVAKATVQTKNPRAIVGGTPLGGQFSEVVVNHVFMRSAILPRPYEGVSTLVEAQGRCIAWPHDRMTDDNKSSRHSKGGGTGRPSQLEGT